MNDCILGDGGDGGQDGKTPFPLCGKFGKGTIALDPPKPAEADVKKVEAAKRGA